MWTLEQIESDLLRDIDAFEIPVRSEELGLVGTPWSVEQYRKEVEGMRRCLIKPTWCEAGVPEVENDPSSTLKEFKRFALVVKDEDSNYVLLRDPDRNVYALGWVNAEGQINAFMFGDAVSIFLAR